MKPKRHEEMGGSFRINVACSQRWLLFTALIQALGLIVLTTEGEILLIDVRDPDEFKAGTFKSAVNIPTDDLEKEIKSLPTDKPIVFVCNTGAKSGEAYYMMKDMRPEVKDCYYLEAES